MDREKIIKTLEDRIRDCSMIGDGFDVTINWKLADEILALLKEQEAVVRCKDCKIRGNISICPLAYIEKTEQFTALCIDEWFCGSGKRKEVR